MDGNDTSQPKPRKPRSAREISRWERLQIWWKSRSKALQFSLATFARLVLSAVGIFVLVFCKTAFEKSDKGSIFEQAVYGWLNHHAFAGNPFKGSRDPNVTVIDISTLYQQPAAGAPRPITPRKELLALIQALVNARALAVGVDVDMFPQGKQIDEADRELFDACKQITAEKGIPVFFAITGNTQYNGRDAWLGDPVYSGMAASGLRVADDSRCMPLHFKKGEELIHGLAAALVRGVRAEPKMEFPKIDFEENVWFDTYMNYAPAFPHEGWDMPSYFMDYTLMHDASILVKGYQPGVVQASSAQIKDKIALIGDVHQPFDSFVIPGVSRKPVPGVLLHASGVATWLDGPIRLPSHDMRLWLDVLTGASVMLLVLLLQALVFYLRGKEAVDAGKAHTLFTMMAALLIFIFWHVLAWGWRIFWADAILVAFALWAHRPVERALLNLPKYIVRFLKLRGRHE